MRLARRIIEAVPYLAVSVLFGVSRSPAAASRLRGGDAVAPPLPADSDTLALSNAFPSLKESVEMSRLSALIYEFHRAASDDLVCPMVNGNASRYGVHCHWYSHTSNSSGSDTQVMIASAPSYVAVVFAGTDDLETSLTDVHLLQAPFGDANHTVPDPRVKVHEGFNRAVFDAGLFDTLLERLVGIYRSDQSSKRSGNRRRLYVTGHSLGAANSVLTAVALAAHPHPLLPARVTSINFGCPRVGNVYYKDFVHEHPAVRPLAVWRVVLGWDLVPRLPELYFHAGHTIQLYEPVRNSSWGSYWWPNATSTAPVAYYRHYGDADLGLAGVPFGWYAVPFLWLPGALGAHRMSRYHLAMRQLAAEDWVAAFVGVPEANGSAAPLDDDEWKNPDDDATVAAVARKG